MSRTMRLTSDETFRAVILRRYPGIHHWELHTYTKADGTTIDYHRAVAYGPYATKAAATGQLTANKDHGTQWFNGTYITPDSDCFIETSETVWKDI